MPLSISSLPEALKVFSDERKGVDAANRQLASLENVPLKEGFDCEDDTKVNPASMDDVFKRDEHQKLLRQLNLDCLRPQSILDLNSLHSEPARLVFREQN